LKISTIVDKLSRPQVLWGTIFLYTLISGLFVQLIFLRYIAPSWNEGHGLLLGMDGEKFHLIALELSQTIQAKGWSAWEPAPHGQLVSGMAAIFYVLIYPEPWSVLPFNSLLNAFAGTGFYLLLRMLIEDKRKSLVATLPFIFFPSAMLWNSQFHNENYLVPAVVFILLGWTIIYIPKHHYPRIQPGMGLIALGLLALGSILFLFTRATTLLALAVIFLICTLLISVAWIWESQKEKVSKPHLFYRLTLSWVACAMMFISLNFHLVDSQGGALGGIDTQSQGLSPRKLLRRAANGIPPDAVKPSSSNPPNPDTSPIDSANVRESTASSHPKWQPSAWLPGFVDKEFAALARNRAAFIRNAKSSGSLVDEAVVFASAGQVLAYTPRALEIGLFSPFPNIWIERGEKPAGSAMRLETAFEMIFSYICLLGLPIFVWKSGTKKSLFALITVCLYILVLTAITNPNQGALYRFRYPYFMTLVCLGLAGWVTWAKPIVAEAEGVSEPSPV